ncbi:MAG: M24 family metallopeptidase [Holosporales bacterium]|jgi:Xaa-Pro aminopeptidase|nr:M24 family metallopeptidase [Holosporales bacterium]
MPRDTYLPTLRKRLAEIGADCVIVSMRNSFGNFEDGPSDIERISGFTGSNGQAVVSRDMALLSVDGRYVKQATEQTNSAEWSIKQFPDFDTRSSISTVASSGSKLAIAPYSISYNSYVSILRLAHDLGISVTLLDDDIMPPNPRSNNTVFLVDEENIGESILGRINKVRDGLGKGEAVLFAEKSTIGWVFGVRLTRATSSKSVLPNCVAFIPKSGRPILFCDLEVVNTSSVFDIRHLDEFKGTMKSVDNNCQIMCDYSTVPAYFVLALQGCRSLLKPSESELLEGKTEHRTAAYFDVRKGSSTVLTNQEADCVGLGSGSNGLCTIDSRNKYSEFFCVKNKTEIKNQKIAAELTSLAFIRTLVFAMNEKGISELDVANFFEETVSKCPGFVDLSFTSISAFGEDTSLVHYIPRASNNAPINGSGLFLFDAGAHFNNSTTDMTRTVFIGNFDEYSVEKSELRDMYTTILKSVIMFSRARFPVNTKACNIDSIARYEVWQGGYDYQFGTGHGVGSYGNVHEPPRISPMSQHTIRGDMVITVEPGIYRQNFGIRLENMLLTKHSQYHEKFLDFDTLNYIPFCMDLINPEMLTDIEIDWLNDYHQNTYDKFMDILANDGKATTDWFRWNARKIYRL